MELSPTKRTATDALYGSLPIRPWQTRLLKLRADDARDTISGDLYVADITFLDGAVLHDCQKLVEYDALSYTWGDGPHCR